MEKVAYDEMFDYFEAEINVGIKRFKYMFYLEDNYTSKWYNSDGFFDYMPQWGFFSYSYINPADIFEDIEWYKNSVVYQIFPDRFAKSFIDPVGNDLRYGGSIKGIMDKVDYLVNLGVDAIYLNPIFESSSYHRYDIIDYYEIDPLFGQKNELKKMIDKFHEKGIKIIFDAVFNHSSDKFFAFKDLVKNGGYSKYKDWYYVHSFPVSNRPLPNYECFAYYGGMPKLNTTNPETAQYLLDVIRYWTIEFGVDGWRFDVADEIDRNFLRSLRAMIKKLDKNILLIGEIFDEASTWLCGDQFDTVTNYPLKALINDLFAHKTINVELFKMRLNNYIMKFNKKAIHSMLNIISTHDTPRFLTLCEENEKMFELALVFQFTFPGVPHIYYGDEIGMKGEGDPECRKPMIWQKTKWNKKLLDLYNFLISIRKQNEALRIGDYREIPVKGGKEVLAYIREGKRDGIIILINTQNHKSKIEIGLGSIPKNTGILSPIKGDSEVPIESKKATLIIGPLEWRVYKILKK